MTHRIHPCMKKGGAASVLVAAFARRSELHRERSAASRRTPRGYCVLRPCRDILEAHSWPERQCVLRLSLVMYRKVRLQIGSFLLKLTGLFFALLVLALPSFGFCPKPDPTVSCEFLDADAVFVGTVASARSVPPRGEDLGGWLYGLTVQELFRGPRTTTIEVFTENSSGRLPLEVAKQYLLFADEFDGRLTITNCGNSAEVSKAQNAIRELRGLQIPKDAAIEGRISFSGIPDSGTHIPGIRITVRGDGRIFEVTSDREGWFHLNVPPGKYSAEVQQIPHWTITQYDLSYDNPSKFDAREGHCSGLQFVATPQ